MSSEALKLVGGGTPRLGADGTKTPREKAMLMTSLQKLGQSRLVFARNLWSYTMVLRYITVYLVRFGESHSFLSSGRDPILFKCLSPLLNPRFLFPIANLKEEQPPSSYSQLTTFLDAVVSPESVISNKSLVLPRLQGLEDQLKARFDKALLKGFEGIEGIAKDSMPSSAKKPDWQLANALFLVDLVGKLFSAIIPQCDPITCPDMDIAEDAFYLWKDEILTGGIVLPAAEYARSVFRWVGGMVKIFEKVPEKAAREEHAAAVRRFCTNLFAKMAHLLGHIKYRHLIKEEAGGGKTKSSPAITKSGKRPKKEEIKITKRGNESAFANQIKKAEKRPRNTTLSSNVPLILVEMTDYLLREEVEVNISKAVELEEKQSSLASSLVLDFKKGHDLTTVKPEVVLGAVATFLQQMKTSIIPPDYIECFEMALTMPTVDIRLACVEKTLVLFKGLARELLCFVFSFLNSLVQDKRVDTYEICSYFASKILRSPQFKVSPSLSTAVTHLILTNFDRFFPDANCQNSSIKLGKKSPRVARAGKKKSRGNLGDIGKMMEKREEDDDTEETQAQGEKGNKFGTFNVRGIEVEVEEEDNNNNDNNFGTFIMKDAANDGDNNNNFGTFVMKDAGDSGENTNNFGTFVMKDSGDDDNNSNNFGTFVMNDTGSDNNNNNFGTFVMNDGASDGPTNFGTFVMNEGASSDSPRISTGATPRKAHAVLDNYIQQAKCDTEQPVRRSYLGGGSAIAGRTPRNKTAPPGGGGGMYREPEKWEKNLVSLTKGELDEGMDDSAFHRYTKKRGGLQAMDWSASASAEEKNEEIEKALDGEEAKKIKQFASIWKRQSMLTDNIENMQEELRAASLSAMGK